MYLVREHEVTGDRMDPPYARVVKHLVAAWNAGATHLWLGVSVIDPLSSSNLHVHEGQEEVFYCLSGRGRIRVGDEEASFEPGCCVFVPPGVAHQLINTQSDEVLRVLSATAPPFSREGWSNIHAAGGADETVRKE
jgi:mannose-6-phosphate isomerase-like protein (cupin superfamily)